MEELLSKDRDRVALGLSPVAEGCDLARGGVWVTRAGLRSRAVMAARRLARGGCLACDVGAVWDLRSGVGGRGPVSGQTGHKFGGGGCGRSKFLKSAKVSPCGWLGSSCR
jgi:hypothetical protein